MTKRNKGEWTEIYSFFKIINDQKLTLADKNLNVLNYNNFFNVTKVSTLNIEELCHLKSSDRVIVENKATGTKKEIQISNIINNDILCDLVSKIKKGKGAFQISKFDSIQDYFGLNIIHGGNSNQKSDIVLDIDNNEFKKELEGFGIKSELGASPTLLNASLQTNFIYEIESFSVEHIGVVNSIKTRTKLKDRISKIQKLGGSFKFINIESNTLRYNFSVVDSIIPELISKMLLCYFTKKTSSINSNLRNLYDSGDLSNFAIEDLQSFTAKIKRLLVSVLLGFFPNIRWDGKFDAKGLIVVKENGDQVGFHCIDISVLEDYLFEKVKFDTPSTTRHRFGEIYERDGKTYFKLNLQLRM
jgi:DNA (cytosine-5)-methyltransferase 1